MKRIIICCDGTWNTPDQRNRGERRPSNVVKMVRGITPLDSSDDPDVPIPQIVYYREGVGTGRGSDKWLGGGTGLGLSENIVAAYRFIANNYLAGDAIFLFGFSRGAYTVRSLVGLIDHAGLLPKEELSVMEDAYELYRSLKEIDPGQKDPEAKAEMDAFLAKAKKFREVHGCLRPEIEFLGVWDTVGSLGIPVARLKRYSFHKPHASRLLKRRFQALAIDEKRTAFCPTLWAPDDVEPIEQFEQRWFPGVHTNIGGGYEDDGLENTAFHWLKDKAIAAGLKVNVSFLDQFEGSHLGELRKSKKGFYHLLGGDFRRIPYVKFGNETVDESAIKRARSSSLRYRPNNLVDYCAQKKISI